MLGGSNGLRISDKLFCLVQGYTGLILYLYEGAAWGVFVVELVLKTAVIGEPNQGWKGSPQYQHLGPERHVG
jgi:hypothetical protein